MINVPVYCFMVHATSSCLFLVVILWLCNTTTKPYITVQEYILWTFVLGRVLVETQQIQRTRMTEYLSSMWNIVDIISLILFVAIIVMRISFYFAFHTFHDALILTGSSNVSVYNFHSENQNLNQSESDKLLDRVMVPKIGAYTENDLLAVINIIYSINSIIACTRLLPLFEASYSLGPLQLTMGGMLADLSKIICLLFTVILAFSLGIAKLYNSRYFYLYVDGNADLIVDPSNNETKPFLIKTRNDTVEKEHKLRSMSCLYWQSYSTMEIDDCMFGKNHIQPVLFRE